MTLDPRPGPRASARPEAILGSLDFLDLCRLSREPDSLEWLPFHRGVEIHWIYREKNDGHSAALIRFQPGGSVPLHEHQGFEHIYILSGSQSNDTGSLTEGSLMVHPPGTRHSIFSEAGCIALAIYEKPARFDLGPSSQSNGLDSPCQPVEPETSSVFLAVNGTLMRGLELNPNLIEAGAAFVRETTTAPCYRLWSINDRHPAMVRAEAGAGAVAVEVWRIPPEGLASVLLNEPPGLSVGKVKLADGTEVLGVLGEPALCQGHLEITEFGGWRAYVGRR